MSEVYVPDFKNDADFRRWVDGLGKTEIQSWKTKDWNHFYEKLNTYIAGSLSLKIEQGLYFYFKGQKISKEGLFMARNLENLKALAKLYRNYRFEPQVLDSIRQAAQRASMEIAQKDGFNIEEIPLMPYYKNKENYKQITKEALEIVSNQSAYSAADKAKMKIKTLFSPFIRAENAQVFRSRDINKASYILHGEGGESFLEIMFHEAAHIYLQAGTGEQVKLLQDGKMALPELGEDFYKLLRNNARYYLSGNGKSFNMLPPIPFIKKSYNQLSKDEKKEFFIAYKKQPIEKFSNIYGIITEREYRRKKLKVSERGAIKMVQLLKEMCGYPSKAVENEAGVELQYKSKYISPQEMLDRINYITQGFGKRNLEKLNIRLDEKKGVSITVPRDNELKSKIEMYGSYLHYNAHISYLSYMRQKAVKKIDKKMGTHLSEKRLSPQLKKIESTVSRTIREIRNKIFER